MEIHTAIFVCCREWVGAIGYPMGKCGLCNTRPVYLRPDPLSPIITK